MSDAPEKAPGKAPAKIPERIRLMLLLFAVAVGGEILHQVLNITIGLMDPSALTSAAREGMRGSDVTFSDSQIRTAAIASIFLAGAFGIAVMGLLGVMLRLIRRRSKYAGLARRMLLVFGFYFGFRVLMLFMASPGGTRVPVAMYLVDGSVQIIVGVAAVLGLVFSFSEEVLRWTGEIDSSGRRTDPRQK